MKNILITALIFFIFCQISLAHCRRTFHYKTPTRSKTIEETCKSINTFNKPHKYIKTIEESCANIELIKKK